MLDGNFDSNGKVWAAGVSGGIWSITNIEDPTSEWSKVSDFWDNLVITCIASDPTDANIIYVGTGERRGQGLRGQEFGKHLMEVQIGANYHHLLISIILILLL